MRHALPVALALALASCTSGTTDGRPSPTASPSAAPAANSLVVAVTREKHPGVWLYRLDARRQAHLMAQLPPPGGHRASRSLTLSGGTTPDLCALWHRDPPASDAGGAELAYCYPASDPARGGAVATGSLGVIALDPAAKRVFWTTVGEEEEVERANLGVYRSGQVHAISTAPIDCSTYVLGAVWAGNDRLVLHCTSGDNDDPGSLWTEQLGSGARSPQASRRIGDWEQFGSPGAGDETSIMALEHVCESDCGTEFAEKRPARAVRVDIATGRVLEVIATPAEGRSVVSVTGGEHGVVYVTEAAGQKRDLRAYVRWPGEDHGTPITGLPSDVETVVAQP